MSSLKSFLEPHKLIDHIQVSGVPSNNTTPVYKDGVFVFDKASVGNVNVSQYLIQDLFGPTVINSDHSIVNVEIFQRKIIGSTTLNSCKSLYWRS
jgi:hypothetical protein